jgi:hypothetical protein
LFFGKQSNIFQVVKNNFMAKNYPLGILLFLFIFSALTMKAQVTQRTCGAMDHLHHLHQQNPLWKLKMDQVEEHSRRIVQKAQQNQGRDNLGVISIPVVVHIVYANNAQNLADSRVFTQIDVLNEDFRRLNSDTTSTWSQAADSEIEFCLASVDPNGLPTTGINRVSTTSAPFSLSNDEIKYTSMGGVDAWPRDEYLNIWVGQIQGGILGYAQFPGGPAAEDGVVIGFEYFGRREGASAPFNLGRTATHEVGHWLGLRHIWGDGNCSVDDGIADTPESDASNFGCPNGHISCSTVDMIENYMDYTNDACMNLFTEGQKTKMRSYFASGGARSAILNSGACCFTGECELISTVDVSSDNDTSFVLNIPLADSGSTYIIRYQELGSGTWDTLSGLSDTLVLIDGLQACTDYVIQYQTDCGSNRTTFSCVQESIQTLGCCEVPSGELSAVVQDSATLVWDPVYGAINYDLRVRLLGESIWNNFSSLDTTFTLDSLLECQAYEYQLRTVCKVTPDTAFSTLDTLYTDGCGQCSDTSYCEPQAIGGQGGVAGVEFGPISNTPNGMGKNGYSNFSFTGNEFFMDSTYDITMTAIDQFPHAWKVWIDLDRDGEFNDSTELLLDNPGPTQPINSQITIPELATAGPTRMRIGAKLSVSSSSWDACNMDGFGEYEDYCIFLNRQCRKLTSISSLLDTTSGSIKLDWDAINYADSYEYGYQFEGDSLWTSYVSDSNFAEINMDTLYGCTRYVFRARFVCEDGSGTYVISDTLKTSCRVGLERPELQSIKLYPNPANNLLEIESSEMIHSVDLYSLQGEKLNQMELNAWRGKMDLSVYPQGVYLLGIKMGVKTEWKRIVIQR